MPDVLMNYQQMDDMVNTVNQVVRDLEDSMSAIGGSAQKLSTSFMGVGGSAMQDALNQTLKGQMQTLHDAMTNMVKDLQTAIEDTKQGVLQSKSPYGG